jgi:hypothetical protein
MKMVQRNFKFFLSRIVELSLKNKIVVAIYLKELFKIIFPSIFYETMKNVDFFL